MSSTDSTMDIMERIRRRKAELGESKENLALPLSGEGTHIEKESEQEASPSINREIFAKIAADYGNYESSPTKMAGKESLMKGRSPRLSYGDGKCHSLTPPNRNLPQVSSSANSSPENSCPRVDAKHIQFAHPVSATQIFNVDSSMTTINESTILAGSGFNASNCCEMMQTSENTSTVNHCELSDQEASLQYGAHTFMKKKVMKPSESSSSLNLSSPKPFVSGARSSNFSPVQFNPVSTSSPLKVFSEKTTPVGCSIQSRIRDAVHPNVQSKTESSSSARVEDSTVSPIRAAAIENANAKNVVKELEAMIRRKGPNIPTPHVSSVVGIKNAFEPKQDEQIRTLFRGSAGTPVVLGASADVVNKADILSTNLQSLRDRWEFSSKTGTPIHPDKSGEKLVDDARMLQQTSMPSKPIKVNDPSSGMLTPIMRKNPVQISPDVNIYEHTSYNNTPSPDIHTKLKNCEADTPTSTDDLNPVDGNISKLFDFLSESPAQYQHNTSINQQMSSGISPATESPVVESYVVEESHLPDDCHSESSNKRTGDSAINLPYSLSFYRKRGRMNNASEAGTEVINLNKFEPTIMEEVVNEGEDGEKECERKKRLTVQCKVQETVISQVQRALRHCKSQEPFRGSREEVEAHRSLLLATEARHVLEMELDKYNNGGRNKVAGPLGSVVISDVNVYIQKEFLRSFQHLGSNSGMTCYFMLVLKLGEHVSASTVVSIDEITKDCLEFGSRSERDQQLLNLENVSPDFQCIIEVYKLMAPREQFSHEEKYRIKGSTRNKTSLANIPSGRSDTDYEFQRVGYFTIDINTPIRQKRHHFSFADRPLDNEKGFVIRMKMRALGQSNFVNQGFLSMYQRTREGLGSWNRYYCVLESGEMKFWKSPEDHTNNKNWLVLLDLHTCVAENGEGARPVEETCFLHPFHVDVWVPKDDMLNETLRSTSSKPIQNVEKLRVMLAASTNSELQTWLRIVNETVRHISMWSPKH